MADRINSPVLQRGLLAWGAVCLFGAALGAGIAMTSPAMSQRWQGGGALIVLCLLGWVALAAIVWFDQRELAVERDAFVVRRWTDVALGLPGRQLPRLEETHAILYGGELAVGVRLYNAAGSIKFATNLWPRAVRRELLDYLTRYGVDITLGGSILDD